MIAVRTCAACDGAWVGRCAQTAQRNVPLYFRCGECNKAVHSPLVCACVVTSKEEGVVFCSKACKISFDDEKVRVCDLVSAAPLAQAPEVIELEAIELHPPVTPRPPLHPPLHAAPRPPLHTALQPPTRTPLHPAPHPPTLRSQQLHRRASRRAQAAAAAPGAAAGAVVERQMQKQPVRGPKTRIWPVVARLATVPTAGLRWALGTAAWLAPTLLCCAASRAQCAAAPCLAL